MFLVWNPTPRLDSWKEIASYMRRGVRTVQRWHEVLNLPVHHIASSPKSPVFAFRDELDRWVQQRADLLSNGQQELAETQERPIEAQKELPSARQLRQKHRIHELLVEETEQNRFTFMSIDLDAALTLAKIAAGASNSSKRKRNAANARRALVTVAELLTQSKLQVDAQNVIKVKIAEVRAVLKKIPPPQRQRRTPGEPPRTEDFTNLRGCSPWRDTNLSSSSPRFRLHLRSRTSLSGRVIHQTEHALLSGLVRSTNAYYLTRRSCLRMIVQSRERGKNLESLNRIFLN
jgi:hypothetical protein